MIKGRKIHREEIKDIWAIDRREIIEQVYYLENGTLVLKPEYYNMPGWPPGEAELYTPILEDCYDRGGWFYGLFDREKLIGVAVLDNHFIGKKEDRLQLKFLHISRPFRGRGWGKHLFELAVAEARKCGAQSLYISATPSENTIDFYLNLGCQVTNEVDPALFALEPEDIHLEYNLELHRDKSERSENK
ncbi:GNAT family N-acetyltransferase [Candidatus Uhrbacteria bacterium]|nr:GNAT family N-acetyltransferase [Candidatus Uhrbacteria bacterium]